MNNRETMARLNAALNSIDSAYAVIAKRHGMTFNSLMVVCMIDESSNVTQQQICEVLHLPKSTVHSIILGFIESKFLSLKEGANKKEKFLVFTSKGEKHFAQVLEDVCHLEDKVLTALGESTCAFLVEATEKFGEMFNKEIASTSVR